MIWPMLCKQFNYYYDLISELEVLYVTETIAAGERRTQKQQALIWVQDTQNNIKFLPIVRSDLESG